MSFVIVMNIESIRILPSLDQTRFQVVEEPEDSGQLCSQSGPWSACIKSWGLTKIVPEIGNRKAHIGIACLNGNHLKCTVSRVVVHHIMAVIVGRPSQEHASPG
jgi:hypothetical protein